MSVRLLHTSDLHLGATFKVLGERGREQSRQLRETLRRVVDLAIEERVGLVVIAGDLFDSIPAARVEVGFAAGQLARLGDAGIPACVIAGNHDPFEDGSVSVWGELAGRSSGLRVFGPDLETQVFPEQDLTVIGRSIRGRLTSLSPLAGLPVPKRTRYVVGIAHGGIQRPDLPPQFGLITSEEIAASGVDYLALGDWHSLKDMSSGGVAAWYSGAPEMIDLDEPGSGQVCLVTVREAGEVDVMPRRVGRRRAARLTADVATAGGPEAVVRMIRDHADPDTALILTLTGLAALGDRVNIDRLREDLAPEFFRLELRDESHLRAETIDPSQYPEQTVIGRFVRLMYEQIASREGDMRAIAEDALAYGVALLEGKEILG
jgi:DNA repair protein SbcD/Mre11